MDGKKRDADTAADADGLKGKVARLLICVGVLSLAVGGAIAAGASSTAAIVVGGGVGAFVSYFVMRLFGVGRDEGHGSRDYLAVRSKSIVGPKWFGLWFLALCAFHFGVGLSWVESVCCVAALIGFFVIAERFNRARTIGR